MKSKFIDDGIKQDQASVEAVVFCKCTAEVLWYRIPQTEWKDDEVKKQIDQATAWFRKYCIPLTFRELTVDPVLEKKKTTVKMSDLAGAYHAIVGRIPGQTGKSSKEADSKDAESSVEEIYNHLMSLDEETQKAAGKKDYKPRHVITVLFLDEWYNNTSEEGAGMRPARVSANSQTQLLIGMSRFDRASQNMLTHELTHAMRRQGRHNNKTCFQKFVKENHVTDSSERGWEQHYSGKAAAQDIAMTHVTRKDGTAAEYDLTDERLFSVREYLTVVKAGYVECQPGCDEEHNEPGVGTDR